MKIKPIIETFLGFKRPNVNLTKEFMEYRIELFKDTTLKSILGQTYEDNIDLIIHTDKKWSLMIADAMPNSIPINRDILISTNMGKEYYRNQTSQYLAIFRIDSDDLYHRKAIEKTMRKIDIKHLYKKGKRFVLAFKNNICWDKVNGCIAPHIKSSTPFYVHVFPKKMYSNSETMNAQHFCQHGVGGAGDRQAFLLDENMVCVVKHGRNWSLLKRGLPPFRLSREQLKILKTTNSSDYNLHAYEKAIWDKGLIKKIMRKYNYDI